MKYYKKKRNTRKPYKTRKFNPRIKAVIKSKKIPALFPLTKQCRLVYKNPSTTISSGGLTSYTSQVFACNNCNDFDYSNNLGNKSPLYWDYLCTAQGPYKKFRVNAWKTTLKVINLSDKALNVYFDHGTLGAVTDADTPQEMQNRQGISHRMLTAQNNAKPMCTFTSFRKLSNFIKVNQQDSNLDGSYNANPFTGIFSTLLLQTIDGSTTAFTYALEVTHVFYVTLNDRDMILST